MDYKSISQANLPSVSLYYREGASDKVYNINIEPSGDGYVVNFSFGRRGSTLTAGTKTNSPIALDKAKVVFDKLKREKEAKGYSPGETGTPYVATPNEDRTTDWHVQLLNVASEQDMDAMMKSDAIGLQEKFDGKRMILCVDAGRAYAVNRNGLVCGFPKPIETCLLNLGFNCSIDGECIGDAFYAFDMLSFDNKDIRNIGYAHRYVTLKTHVDGDCIHVVPLITGTENKRAFFNKMHKLGKEGVVLKDLNAPYKAGRPSSGGSQFKHKFQSEATCIVSSINKTKRSVSLQVRGTNGYVDIGNCAIPTNKQIPNVNDMVEIRYLYCYPNGSLYQPFYKGIRDDKDNPDTYESLKFKST